MPNPPQNFTEIHQSSLSNPADKQKTDRPKNITSFFGESNNKQLHDTMKITRHNKQSLAKFLPIYTLVSPSTRSQRNYV